MDKNLIFLIGMSHAGKTVLGQQLAQDLGLDFYDTDLEIEKIYNMGISQVYEKFGDKKFRDIEFDVLKNFEDYENTIVSTGGGVIENILAYQFLRLQEKVVFIDTDPNIIFERIEQANFCVKSYPKFLGSVENKNEAKLEFMKVYERRLKIYSAIANIHFKNKTSLDEAQKQLKHIILSDTMK